MCNCKHKINFLFVSINYLHLKIYLDKGRNPKPVDKIIFFMINIPLLA